MSQSKSERIPLLDGCGYVELLDTFGDDLTVVNAARVSFAKESTVMEPRDEKLIHYLADHHHITPFFHPQLRFRLKMPIYVAREWFRHTIGFARNEVSRRYVDDAPEFYLPQVNSMRERDTNIKQGSKTTAIEEARHYRDTMKTFQSQAADLYWELIKEANLAPELARGILPQSMYTEFIETGSLSAYARLCSLRLDPQAQEEIRVYAAAVSGLIQEKFPVSWKSLSK
jgi:thymidylate synthase (FAD)